MRQQANAAETKEYWETFTEILPQRVVPDTVTLHSTWVKKKPPILTDFQGKTTLQKNVLQGGNTAHLARNKFMQKTQVHISKRAVLPSQLIRAALKEAAAESAALGSSVQFFFPVTFSNNTDKGLFLFQKIRL